MVSLTAFGVGSGGFGWGLEAPTFVHRDLLDVGLSCVRVIALHNPEPGRIGRWYGVGSRFDLRRART